MVLQNEEIIERFFIRLAWLASLYTLNEIDKLSSPVNIENELGNALKQMYEKAVMKYNGENWKMVVETAKEEAADMDEVLSSNCWDIITLESHGPLSQHSANVENLIQFTWGHESINQ